MYYFIPIYNSLQCLVGIFTFDFSVINLLLTIGINVIYTVVFIIILAKMFNNEKIMFSK